MPPKNLAEFECSARKVHGDRYDYSGAVYVSWSDKTRISIICKVHGSFEQRPRAHVYGAGCPRCANEKLSSRKTSTMAEFLEKAKKVHGDRYDYSKVDYRGVKFKIRIGCKIHGDFDQTARQHLVGSGCQTCGNIGKSKNQSSTAEQFTKKAEYVHEGKYEYENVEYVNGKVKVAIRCPEHGIFLQAPDKHLAGKGCPKCKVEKLANIFRRTENSLEEQAREIHGTKYEYDFSNYENNRTPILIRCPDHGEFYQTMDSHFLGNGCRKCTCSGASRIEQEVFEYVASLDPNALQHWRPEGTLIELDSYSPVKRIAVELNGVYWHSNIFLSDTYHLDRLKKCKELGIELIQIFEDEWLYKKDIVKSLLASRFNKSEYRIFARKTTVSAIDVKDARAFYEANHIQGFAGAKYHYGLISENKIAAMASFSEHRRIFNKNKTNNMELVRFCNTRYANVVGGLSKLLNVMEGREIISYCDKRLFSGAGYLASGFEIVRESKPSYYYVVKRTRQSRIKFQKHKLANILRKFDSSKTEWENMKDNGYYRVFDCGNIVMKLN